MIGGEQEIFQHCEPIFKTLAPPRTATATWARTAPATSSRWCITASSTACCRPTARASRSSRSRSSSLDLREVTRVWQNGSVVRSWLLDLAAPRLQGRPDACAISVATSRIRARAAGRCRRHRRGCARAGHHALAVAALRLAPAGLLLGEGDRRAAQPVRRPRGASSRRARWAAGSTDEPEA